MNRGLGTDSEFISGGLDAILLVTRPRLSVIGVEFGRMEKEKIWERNPRGGGLYCPSMYPLRSVPSVLEAIRTFLSSDVFFAQPFIPFDIQSQPKKKQRCRGQMFKIRTFLTIIKFSD